MLKEQNFDAIVYNIGTTSVVPRIPGVDQADWVQATDLLCEPRNWEMPEEPWSSAAALWDVRRHTGLNTKRAAT